MKSKKLELKAHKMQFQLKFFLSNMKNSVIEITYLSNQIMF